jgi:hypothetical protein
MPRWIWIILWFVVGVVVMEYCDYQALRRGEEYIKRPSFRGEESLVSMEWFASCMFFWPVMLIHYLLVMRKRPFTDSHPPVR